MRLILILLFVLSLMMPIYSIRIQGEWEFHQWRLDGKVGSAMTFDFGKGDNVKDVPQFLWGCQVTCGMVGTWAIKGNFLYITMVGKSSFYLIQVSETEWRGVGHILYHPAECSMFKIQ